MTPLQEACEQGHEETVEMLLKKKAKVDAVDVVKRTPLHFAAERGNPKIIQMLLDHGANPNVINRDSESPLFFACENDHLEAVKILFPVTSLDTGKSSLRVACFKNHTQIVEYLLENDGSLDLKNRWGATLLNSTCASKQKTKIERDRVIRLLLERGAPLIENKHNEHPLHQACDHNFKSTIGIFLEYDVDVNALRHSETALLRTCIRKGYTIARRLLEKKADPNIPNRYGTLPLEYVIGSPKLSRLLLQHGAKIETLNYFQQEALFADMADELFSDVFEDKKEDLFPQLEIFKLVANLQGAYQKEDKERTAKIVEIFIKKEQREIDVALGIACLKNFTQAVELLIKLGANPDQSDKKNNGLLAMVCEKGFYEIAKLLLEPLNHANVASRLCGYLGYTALHCACIKGDERIVELLLAKGANVNTTASLSSVTPLHLASSQGNPVIIKMLLEKGANSLQSSSHIETPIFLAAKYGHLEAVEFLYEVSDVTLRDVLGRTPCHIACFNGHRDVVEFLISKIDYTKEENFKFNSLLHCACRNQEVTEEKRNALVRMLLENNFDVNAENEFGETPLLLTCANNFESTSKILIESKANVHVQGKTGEKNTPLLLASWKRSYPTVELLLQYGANPNVRNSQATLPLNHANFDIAKLLLEHGSATDGQYIYGTHLHAACVHNEKEMVELLLSYNADPLLINKDRKSSLLIAQERGFSHLEKLLLDKIHKQST